MARLVLLALAAQAAVSALGAGLRNNDGLVLGVIPLRFHSRTVAEVASSRAAPHFHLYPLSIKDLTS
jgi:hypothetical protein